MQSICIFLFHVLHLLRFLELKIVYRANNCGFVGFLLINVVVCGILTWKAVLLNLFFVQSQFPHPPQIFLFAATPAIIYHIEGIKQAM